VGKYIRYIRVPVVLRPPKYIFGKFRTCLTCL